MRTEVFTRRNAVLPGWQPSVTAAAITSLLLGVTVLPIRAVHAQTYTNQTIQSTANIYGAGRTGSAAIPSPGGTTSGAPGAAGGTAAPAFALSAGTNRVLTFSGVSGSLTFDYPDNYPIFDADGGTDVTSSISAYDGISGFTETDRHGSLVGVFISGPPAGYPDGTSGSAATSLAYTATGGGNLTYNAASYSPALNQTFFIGDGLTGDGSGAVQNFFVPNGATMLVLGFSDGPAYNGAPGSYNDNSGSLTASFTVSGGSAAAPEPGSLALLLAGPAFPLVFRAARKLRQRRLAV